MHLLITGGTGLIGVPLVNQLLNRGDQVTLLTRHFPKAKALFNNRVNLIGSVRGSALEADAVINLAGEPIIDKRWTDRRKQQLKSSRIGVTNDIVHWINECQKKPEALISGSAIGYYGNYPDNTDLDESAQPRQCFASELCCQWEASAVKAESFGVRVCTVRTGVVLAKHGGALKRMWLPFQMGLGGPIATGDQWFSWIHLADMVNLLIYLIDHKTVSGPVNATAPEPVTNAEFSQQFAHTLSRPAWLPLPAIAIKLLLGEASQLLLEGQRVIPQKLLSHGFQFRYPELGKALNNIVE